MKQEKETENFKFFIHKECEFFPCHDVKDPERFNCLFCYCPLYALGPACGGNFIYTEKGVKDCTDCIIPHQPGGFEYVVENFSKIIDLVKKKARKQIVQKPLIDESEVFWNLDVPLMHKIGKVNLKGGILIER